MKTQEMMAQRIAALTRSQTIIDAMARHLISKWGVRRCVEFQHATVEATYLTILRFRNNFRTWVSDCTASSMVTIDEFLADAVRKRLIEILGPPEPCGVVP